MFLKENSIFFFLMFSQAHNTFTEVYPVCIYKVWLQSMQVGKKYEKYEQT